MTMATTPTTAPVTKSADMLLPTPAAMSGVSNGAELHCSAPGVGMNATPGASIPARFINASSPSVLPLRATRQAPIVTSTPMKTACTGV
jgi:hypothetical protein